MKIVCAFCGCESEKPRSAVDRAARIGAPLYCDKICAGKGRRKNITPDEKKAAKSVYDAKRRLELGDEIRAAKRAYHQRTYDPIAAAKLRAERMPLHVEYCRQPNYRQYKKTYDRKYRAEKSYGEFSASFLELLNLEEEISSRMTKYEIRQANGTLNKNLQRRRDCESIVGC